MEATSIVFASAAAWGADAPKFEVASIRACGSGDLGGRSGNGSASSSTGLLNLSCSTVQDLIQDAYGRFADGRVWHPWRNVPVEGGPNWVRSDRYRIEAKAESPEPSQVPSEVMMNGPMLQGLLEERLRLKIHHESREVPVYALTVAKGGAKLPRAEGGCAPVVFPPAPIVEGQPLPTFCGMGRASGKGFEMQGTMADLCTFFSTRMDRAVIDETGLAGMFAIHLDFSVGEVGYRDSNDPGAAPVDAASIFAALRGAVRKLGLQLDATRGPGEFLVIDHVERPSEN
jgi:uncharacterized protein (TIGR03435 family)